MSNANLEETIRDLAARGELSHISLSPSQNGKLWRASFTMCSKFGVSFGEDEDPIKALMLACTTAKMAPRHVGKHSPIIDHNPHEVSAPPVTEDVEDLM
jgi:hypothetical protein